MRTIWRKAVSVAVACIMLLSIVSLASLAAPEAHAELPLTDYHENDRAKLSAFLEIEDENGVKNGVKVNSNYNAEDPSTWGASWNADGRLTGIFGYDYKNLTGEMDLSGCEKISMLRLNGNNITHINLSGCTSLIVLFCQELPFLRALNLSGCSGLKDALCWDNASLSEIRLSGCEVLTNLMIYDCALDVIRLDNHPLLQTIDCRNNQLTALDVSGCPNLINLSYTGNTVNELKFIHNPRTGGVDTARIGAGGTVGFTRYFDSNNDQGQVDLIATPNEGYIFDGWYNHNGILISRYAKLSVYYLDPYTLEARFVKEGEPIPEAPMDPPIGDDYEIPDSAYEPEYRTVIEFLEQKDADGVKNGYKLNPMYNPQDANTIISKIVFVNYENLSYPQMFGMDRGLLSDDCGVGLTGNIDFSGFSKLWVLSINGNSLKKVDVSDNPNLEYIYARGNGMVELNLSGSSRISQVLVNDNKLTSIDLTEQHYLEVLDLRDNPLTSIKVNSRTMGLMPGTLTAEGYGYIGAHKPFAGQLTIYAYPADGEEFLGWYDEEGNLFSSDAETVLEAGRYDLTARFTQNVEPTPTPEQPTPTPEQPTPTPEQPTPTPEQPTPTPEQPTPTPGQPTPTPGQPTPTPEQPTPTPEQSTPTPTPGQPTPTPGQPTPTPEQPTPTPEQPTPTPEQPTPTPGQPTPTPEDPPKAGGPSLIIVGALTVAGGGIGLIVRRRSSIKRR